MTSLGQSVRGLVLRGPSVAILLSCAALGKWLALSGPPFILWQTTVNCIGNRNLPCPGFLCGAE